MQVLYLGRAPRTKETLPDFREKCRVTRHSRVFRGLTGSQRTPGFGVSQLPQNWGAPLGPNPTTRWVYLYPLEVLFPSDVGHKLFHKLKPLVTIFKDVWRQFLIHSLMVLSNSIYNFHLIEENTFPCGYTEKALWDPL